MAQTNGCFADRGREVAPSPWQGRCTCQAWACVPLPAAPNERREGDSEPCRRTIIPGVSRRYTQPSAMLHTRSLEYMDNKAIPIQFPNLPIFRLLTHILVHMKSNSHMRYNDNAGPRQAELYYGNKYIYTRKRMSSQSSLFFFSSEPVPALFGTV